MLSIDSPRCVGNLAPAQPGVAPGIVGIKTRCREKDSDWLPRGRQTRERLRNNANCGAFGLRKLTQANSSNTTRPLVKQKLEGGLGTEIGCEESLGGGPGEQVGGWNSKLLPLITTLPWVESQGAHLLSGQWVGSWVGFFLV